MSYRDYNYFLLSQGQLAWYHQQSSLGDIIYNVKMIKVPMDYIMLKKKAG